MIQQDNMQAHATRLLGVSYTVPMGGGYIDIADPSYANDYGVSFAQSYSASVSDYGSPGSRTISGSYQTAMTRGTLAPGVYALSNPSAGVTRYTFHSGDVGKVMTINYSSLLGTLYESAIITIPSTGGHTWQVPNSSTFWPSAATEVINQNTGNALVKVASSPASGQFSVTGTPGTPGGGNFTFNASDVGIPVLVKYQQQDTSIDTAHATLNYSISEGTTGQGAWSYSPRVQYLDPLAGNMPTSTMINPQFSILPGQSVAFTLAETSTSLTKTWGSQSLKRCDGSTLSLAGGSHTDSGLTPSQGYYNYAYLTLSGTSVVMNFLGPYTSPSAANAFNAELDGRFYLGVLHDTTPASGTGPGGGTDPGDCPHENELVWIRKTQDGPEARTRIGDVRHGDFIKGWDFDTRQDVYRLVHSFRHRPGTMWMKVKGYLTSVCEHVFVSDAWTPAYKVPGSKKVRGVHANRVEIKVDGHLPLTQRNYWMDNGTDAPLLMHNFIPFS